MRIEGMTGSTAGLWNALCGALLLAACGGRAEASGALESAPPAAEPTDVPAASGDIPEASQAANGDAPSGTSPAQSPPSSPTGDDSRPGFGDGPEGDPFSRGVPFMSVTGCFEPAALGIRLVLNHRDVTTGICTSVRLLGNSEFGLRWAVQVSPGWSVEDISAYRCDPSGEPQADAPPVHFEIAAGTVVVSGNPYFDSSLEVDANISVSDVGHSEHPLFELIQATDLEVSGRCSL